MRLYPYASFVVLALFLWSGRTAGAGEGGEEAAAQPKEATSGTDQQLGDRLERIEKAFEDLGARMDALEKSVSPQPGSSSAAPAGPQGPSPPPVGVAPPTKEAVRDLWKNMKRGITPDQVEHILGPPTHTMEVDAKTVWYYHYENIGGGSVVFQPDGKVIDWQKPPLGWWKLW
jgi:hypothetical protein